MLRRLSIGLLASAVAIAPLPFKAQDGSAEDLGLSLCSYFCPWWSLLCVLIALGNAAVIYC
ncbi:hypothetical protein [Synechococcus sp. MIT S9503]|uniref:hypothetical protein n=1 Tax=Synechococcus sp. MIT S9503 TaxID=3082547 RepID=UPI0039A6F74F